MGNRDWQAFSMIVRQAEKSAVREALTALYVQSVGNLNCSTSCFSPAASVESCSLAEAPS